MYRILLTLLFIGIESISYADNTCLRGKIMGGECNNVVISFPVSEDNEKHTVHKDSIGIVDGHFTYNVETNGLTIADLWYDDNEYPIILFLEKGEISVKIDLRTPHRYTQSGSSVDKEISVFREYMQAIDSMNVDALKRYYSTLNVLNNEYKEMHIDKVEWGEKRDNILVECERLLSNKTNHLLEFCKSHESFKITAGLLYEYLIYNPSRYEEVDSILPYLCSQGNDENMMKILKNKIKESLIISRCKESPIHAISPDFKGTIHGGSRISLHDCYGKYVLLHIGLDEILGKMTSPILSELRRINLVKDKLDLFIISINRYALCSNNEIKKEKINWMVIDDGIINRRTMREVAPISDMFPIKSLPQFFLLDKKGTIIYEWNGLYNYPTLKKIRELVYNTNQSRDFDSF